MHRSFAYDFEDVVHGLAIIEFDLPTIIQLHLKAFISNALYNADVASEFELEIVQLTTSAANVIEVTQNLIHFVETDLLVNGQALQILEFGRKGQVDALFVFDNVQLFREFRVCLL